MQVANRLLRIHANGLVLSRQETVAPISLAIGRFAANIRNRHVGGQSIVRAAQGIADPGTRTGKPFGDVSRIHEHTPGTMRVCLGSHRMNKGDVIDVLRHVRQHGRNLVAAFAASSKGPRAPH